AAEAAVSADGVLGAVGAALSEMGLNGHLALLDPGGAALTVRSVVLDCVGLAQVERVLGRALVGSRIALDAPTPYQLVAEGGPAGVDQRHGGAAPRAARPLDGIVEDRLRAAAGGTIERRGLADRVRVERIHTASIAHLGRPSVSFRSSGPIGHPLRSRHETN